MSPIQIKEYLQTFLASNEIPEDPTSFLLDQRKRYTSQNCLIVQPNSVEKIQKIVRFCRKHRISIVPQGGNTGLVGGSVADGGIVLNLSQLNKIRNINLADNTITVDAGCILQTIQAAAIIVFFH